MIYAFPCQLTHDEDGGFVATFPDVPEAITSGRDRAEALAEAEDALAVALAGYVHEKWDIPTPSYRGCTVRYRFRCQPVIAAKLALYTAMSETAHKKGGPRAIGWSVSESAVRKLTNPDHRSHMSLVQKALRAVGLSLRVEVTAN